MHFVSLIALDNYYPSLLLVSDFVVQEKLTMASFAVAVKHPTATESGSAFTQKDCCVELDSIEAFRRSGPAAANETLHLQQRTNGTESLSWNLLQSLSLKGQSKKGEDLRRLYREANMTLQFSSMVKDRKSQAELNQYGHRISDLTTEDLERLIEQNASEMQPDLNFVVQVDDQHDNYGIDQSGNELNSRRLDRSCSRRS